VKAFEIADKYRVVVMLLGDGYLGQMAEPCVLPEEVKEFPAKPWALTGKTADRDNNIIMSLKLGKGDDYLNGHVKHLFENYKKIEENETLYENYMCDDADFVLCAYGTASRVCKKAVKVLRDQGIKAGLFRPITLWPFPGKQLESACKNAKKVLTVEMSMGQMVQDVKLNSGLKVSDVDFYGEPGGLIPKVDVIVEKVKSYV
ncbi:MAG: transketolase C-terminal domain-containing protein, partial [Spirochaetales bacterium]|nr:transketolase C-terminal domain-containing protein [Spirochaetales bacterium]